MKFVLYNIRYGTGGNVKYGGFLPYITGYLSGTAKHIKTIGEFLKEESGKRKGYPLRTHSAGVWTNGYSDHFPSLIWVVKSAQ